MCKYTNLLFYPQLYCSEVSVAYTLHKVNYISWSSNVIFYLVLHHVLSSVVNFLGILTGYEELKVMINFALQNLLVLKMKI